MKKEEVSIEGFDGKPMATDITLAGGDHPTPLVIYAHGINGFKDWGGMNLIAEKFAEAGISVLKFNFSHNGTPPENPEEFTDLESYGKDTYLKRQYDLKKIWQFTEANADHYHWDLGRVSLIGHSRGGTDAILYARENRGLHKLITWAAVAEATTPWRNLSNDEFEEWKEKEVFYRKNGRTGQDMPINYELYEEYNAHRQRLDVLQAATEIVIPWLIVHGTEDPAVFVKHAYDLMEVQPEAENKIIEGADHVFNRKHPWQQETLPEASEQLLQASLNFILR